MKHFLSIALLLGCFANAAHAQSKPSASAAQSASEAFRAGRAAMEQNNLPRAHAEFAKAVELMPQVAAGHSALGVVLLAEGNAAAAIPELELAHKLNPKDTAAILNLALAYSQQQSYAKAVALFKEFEAAAGALLPDEAATYARALDATGDPAAAREKLDQALARSPDNAELHDVLGTLLAEQKKFGEAAPEFRRAIQLDPKLAVAHLHLGVLLLQQGRPDALGELQKAAALAPSDFQSQLQLGQALVADNQDRAAIPVLKRAVELNSSSVDAKYALALVLQNTGQIKEALPLFEATVAARPEDAAALINLGLALVQSGKAKEAIPYYERALKLNAKSPVLHEDMGVAYLQQSDFNHAIEEFRAGLLLDPTSAHLHYDLGLALKLQDNVPGAIANFQLAAQEDPTLSDPPYTLGILYMQLGRFPEAAQQLEKSLALREDNGDAWSILGSVYKQMEEPSKAVPALRRAIELLPNQPSPHINLAAILASHGDAEGAAEERRIAAQLSRVAVSRQRASFALDTGKALMQKGQLTEAVEQFQTAVSADPNYAEAHRALADALSQQGKKADAALERQKADTLDARAEEKNNDAH